MCLGFPYQFHEMNDNVFIPFEINKSINTPSLKWIQISSFTQAHIMPLTPDVSIILKTHSWQISLKKNQYKNKLSLFHNNVKSLPKHYDQLESYINSLNFTFSLLWLKIGWMSQNRTFMTCKVTALYINFVKEKEEVASPYILKMGLVSPIGLTWNILIVRWSHYLLKLKEVVLICLPMSSLLSFIEC